MFKNVSLILMFLSINFCFILGVSAESVYQKNTAFVSQAFEGDVPKVEMLWLSGEDKKQIAQILNHPFNSLRIRYWQQADSSGVQHVVWILNEIGKEKPITVGVHIKNQQIVNLKVLAFRESRGDEVRHEFFTSQFKAAELTQKNQLTQHIDGITGATMSVRALTKVARLALWLNKKIKTS